MVFIYYQLDYSLNIQDPFIVAVACLLCYRQQQNLQPLWPNSYAYAIEHSIEEIETLALHIMK